MKSKADRQLTFRSSKDENGKEIEAPKPIPIPWYQEMELGDVVKLLNEADPKVLDSIVGDLNSVRYKYFRSLVDTIGIEKVRSDGIVDPELYSYTTIANLPPASKSAFDDDTWDEFKQDYIKVMSTKAGIDDKRAQVGAEILATRLTRVKGNIDALKQFKERILFWFNNTTDDKKESLGKVFEYLNQRCEDFIKANQPETLLATF